MNLFPLERRGAGMVVKGTESPVLAAASDCALLGGVRPESLRLHERGMDARVEYAEYLGADTVVACKVGDVPMMVRLPGRVTLEPGSVVRLGTSEPLHLFDAASGHRVENSTAMRERVEAWS